MKHIFNFSFINLWCNKNLVDTQFLLGTLFAENNPHYETKYFTDPYAKEVKFVFLNTCGFISSGRIEMLTTLHDLLGRGKIVYLLGCGLQYYKGLKGIKGAKGIKWGAKVEKGDKGARRYLSNLSNLSDPLDLSVLSDPSVHFLSWNDIDIVHIPQLIKWYSSTEFGDFHFPQSPIRAYTNAEFGFEYLKIAEWCNNSCSFCIIPKLRGKQKSLTKEVILTEVKNMVASGIQEIILIAQDTVSYGTDLYGKSELFSLLKEIDKIPGDFTYRLLYLYPDLLSIQNLQQLAKSKKFIPYFDIPLQHISSPLLKRMGRFYNEEKIYELLKYIKKSFPTHLIRTNFIIGFPGESEQDHEKLLAFIKEGRCDNIALFEYHDEPLAASSKLDQKVDDATMRKRFTQARQLVNQQLLVWEAKRKGTEQTGYIMEITTHKGQPLITVRPQLHAPEIDPYDEIWLEQIVWTYGNEELEIGDKIVYIV